MEFDFIFPEPPIMKTITSLALFLIVSISLSAQTPETDWKKLDLKGKVKSFKEYTYEASPNAAAVNPSQLKTVTEFLLNENGFITSETAYGKGQSMLYKIIYTYDQNSFLIGKDIFYGPGKSAVQKRYKYDDKGRLLDEEQWLTQNPQNLTHYVYDKNGLLVEKNTLYPYEPDQSFKTTYKYDSRGNLAEKYTDQVGVTFNREIYTYDENGNLVSKSFAKKKSDPAATVKLNYEWDEHGNWVKLTETPDRSEWPDHYVRVRELNYF